MTKRLCLLVLLLTSFIFAQYGKYPYIQSLNVIDTVLPVKILRLTSLGGSGAAITYDYSGRIAFNFRIGLNDSLNIALDFVPVGGGTTIVPYEVGGMAGTKGFLESSGIGGENYIDFKCKITGTPAAQYQARVTINAIPSHVEFVADSLLALMTQNEKILQVCGTGQLVNGSRNSTDINRPGLTLVGYRMVNGTQQPCGGVEPIKNLLATAYASPSAMACTFDTALMVRVGACIAEEYWGHGKYILEAPVTTPVIDPRVGRSYETFSEDPVLTGEIGAAYIRGSNSRKTGTSVKHFACNDIETNRRQSSSNLSERCLREIFAMPFEICVRKGKTLGIMVAFNKINGVYCSGNSHLLTDILKYDWGFKGYTLTDWGSMEPLSTTAEPANAGQDVELIQIAKFGTDPLGSAVNSGAVPKARLDDMARRIVRNKAYSEVYNKPFDVKLYSNLFGGPVHQAVCLELGEKSIVLAKNTKNSLPLDPTKTVALLGPWADTTKVRMSGGGSGFAICSNPINRISWYKGISGRIGASKVFYNPAATKLTDVPAADAYLVFVGVEGETENSDRPLLGIALPGANGVNADVASNALVQQIVAAGKKCIVVFCGGSAAKKEGWADADAIVVAWYPGESQGKALAGVLFGDVNPSGKLSSSWPVSEASLPPWTPANLQHQYCSADTGIGYMWYDRTRIAPFLPFGFGLSYTTYEYSNIRLSKTSAIVGEDIMVTVTVKNTGARDGEEVAQLYLSEKAPALPRPVKMLRGFARVSLKANGESKDVSFKLTPRDFAYFNDKITPQRFVVQPDDYIIQVGPSSANLPLQATLTLTNG